MISWVCWRWHLAMSPRDIWNLRDLTETVVDRGDFQPKYPSVDDPHTFRPYLGPVNKAIFTPLRF